jgi:hypothetical protein
MYKDTPDERPSGWGAWCHMGRLQGFIIFDFRPFSEEKNKLKI